MDIAMLSILWESLFARFDVSQTLKTNPAPIETPKEPEFSVTKSYIGEITGYSSREEETDSTPFTTASGTTVDWGVIATNAYPFGTKVRLPEIYGDQIFVVEDRMHTRYKNRLDIWFPHYTEARRFGIKKVRIEILKETKPAELASR